MKRMKRNRISKKVEKEIREDILNLKSNFYKYLYHDDPDLDNFCQYDLYEKCRSSEFYYDWLENPERLRDEKIDEILGEKKDPKLGDIFPESLKKGK